MISTQTQSSMIIRGTGVILAHGLGPLFNVPPWQLGYDKKFTPSLVDMSFLNFSSHIHMLFGGKATFTICTRAAKYLTTNCVEIAYM